MTPASWARPEPLEDRLLVVDPRAGAIEAARVGDLARWVDARDVVLVNDAATLPASLHGYTPSGARIEVRLLRSGDDALVWRAVLFGDGDWRTRTEDRAPPPAVRSGDALTFGAELSARVDERIHARLLVLRFAGTVDRFWGALYRHAHPVQYAHVARPFALWDVQTAFASRPWASEMPSAARALSWELLLGLRAKGTRFAHVTHAAGLSSTGEATLDRALPFAESFEVGADAVAEVERAHAAGGRVIAIGTSAARAVESAARDQRLAPARGETSLRLGPETRLCALDGILTGVHDAGTSHADLLEAFAPRALLDRAREEAERRGFLGHELGDSMLVLPGALSGPAC